MLFFLDILKKKRRKLEHERTKQKEQDNLKKAEDYVGVDKNTTLLSK